MKKTERGFVLLLVLVLLLQIVPGYPAGVNKALAADDKVVVACVGDSMTYGYQATPATQSYPARLQVMLGDGYEVKNFGVNSKTMISDVADSYVKTNEYQQSIACNPDIVILMLGSNDVKEKYWDKEKYAKDAKKLVETYKNLPSSPRVIFATTPASARFANTDIRMNVIDEELIPIQRQLAEENQWELIDMYAKSKGRYALYHEDGIHFSVEGYYYEAECMYEGVMKKPLAQESLPLRSIYSPTQQTGTEAQYAIDNDYSTRWHSQYTPTVSPRAQHYVVIELEKRSLVNGVEYLPRLDNNVNGIITEYEIEVSNDGGKNYQKVSGGTGTWDETRVWKYAGFNAVPATHVKLISKKSSSQAGNDLTSAVEIRVTGGSYTAPDVQTARENLQKDYDNEVALKRNKADYKEASWNELQEELAQVKSALEDEALSLEALNERTAAFRQAILDLKEIPTTALDPLKVTDARYYIAADNTLLPYRIYVPEEYDETKEYPLLLFLHGAGERGSDNIKQLETSVPSGFFERVLGPEREQYPAIIVAPQCPEGQQWVDTPWANGNYKLSEVPQSNESKAVEELLDELLKEYSIDEGRQYLVGFSMGAFGVWDLVMRHPDRYAAMAAVAGAGDLSMAAEIKEVPIWGFHGQADTVVPFEKSTKAMIEALRAAGGAPRYTEYTSAQTGENGHVIRMAYHEPELLPWMFSQDKTPTDKSRLESLIEKAQGLDLEAYTKESADALRETLKEAREVVEKTGVTQEEVNGAVDALDAAIKALKEKELPFVDIPDQWYHEAVNYVYNREIMTGKDETHFAPGENLARAQFAIILHRMNGSPQMQYTDQFPDVQEGIWYTDAILWAASTGVVTGYTNNGHFGPADNITREQMAVMMYRYAGYKEYDRSQTQEYDGFRDADKVSKFAADAMKWAVASGILTGKDNGTRLDPQGNASRAECAIIIQRFMEKYEK